MKNALIALALLMTSLINGCAWGPSMPVRDPPAGVQPYSPQYQDAHTLLAARRGIEEQQRLAAVERQRIEEQQRRAAAERQRIEEQQRREAEQQRQRIAEQLRRETEERQRMEKQWRRVTEEIQRAKKRYVEEQQRHGVGRQRRPETHNHRREVCEDVTAKLWQAGLNAIIPNCFSESTFTTLSGFSKCALDVIPLTSGLKKSTILVLSIKTIYEYFQLDHLCRNEKQASIHRGGHFWALSMTSESSNASFLRRPVPDPEPNTCSEGGCQGIFTVSGYLCQIVDQR